MISIKNNYEIELMRYGGRIGALVIQELVDYLKPDISTFEINKMTEKLLTKYGVEPAFKNYAPFGRKKYPAAICVSINEEIVHGVPSEKKIKNGDLVSLDLGIKYKNYYTDLATTVGVGKINESDKLLLKATKEALDKVIQFLKAGIRLGDVGFLIQKTIESYNFSVVRDCVGHGIGKEIHEEPSVPNYGQPGKGFVLKEGMTIAVEPMACQGSSKIRLKPDGWTIATVDNKKSAHFEHTLAIYKNGCEVLTSL